MLRESELYDLIGDIHGHASELIELLEHLGYEESTTGYAHPSRQVVFLGDFIDRGREQREVLRIVMQMVRNGHAISVMGNHEFNALAYHTPNEYGFLRPHSDKNRKQHHAFLEAFDDDPQAKAEVLDFFYQLPLWLDLPGLRVVHACWQQSSIDALSGLLDGARLDETTLVKASSEGSLEYEAIETLLKGYEVKLPTGVVFEDKDGYPRSLMRVRWWCRDAQTLGELALPFDIDIGDAGSLPAPSDMPLYESSAKPCFIGHYWLNGDPAPLTNNVACLDYSVAKRGKLVAYRWDGESELTQAKFTFVGADSH